MRKKIIHLRYFQLRFFRPFISNTEAGKVNPALVAVDISDLAADGLHLPGDAKEHLRSLESSEEVMFGVAVHSLGH